MDLERTAFRDAHSGQMTEFFAAKRKVGETWREAVASRGDALGKRSACLSAFDAHRVAGRKDFEAAFLALRDQQCLWLIEGPEDPFSATAPAQEGA